jgi:probable F420-dependent oxidoreductase
VKLGIVTPILRPSDRGMRAADHRPAAGSWEDRGTIEDVARIATEAEALGYDFLSCAEHFALPIRVAAALGRGYWDPLSTLGFLAARTRHIRLATHVIVLGYHHPLEVLSCYGTLDRISGGRLILGVGIGGVEAEFVALGLKFEERGAVADDALRALRASMSSPVPEYHGTHFQFEGIVVEPTPLQAHIPLWVGGNTRRSLRRALDLGDGWIPYGLTAQQVGDLLSRGGLRAEIGERGRSFDLVLPPEVWLDPLGSGEVVHRTLDRYAVLGATALDLSFRSRSLTHYLDQLAEMVRICDSHG